MEQGNDQEDMRLFAQTKERNSKMRCVILKKRPDLVDWPLNLRNTVNGEE